VNRCKLIIPDAGPLNSFYVADALDLLLLPRLQIVIVDAVYDEVTSDLSYPKDRGIKDFVDRHLGTEIIIEETFIGKIAREMREKGTFETKENIGEQAIVGFMSSTIKKYVSDGQPYVLLYEDSDILRMPKPDFAHLVSTVAFLRRLEGAGLIVSADDVIYAMEHPRFHGVKGRVLNDQPDGTEIEAQGGSGFCPSP
jgi:hypothetical protein